MSKIIVYLPVGLNHPELEVILSRTQLILDQGHEVDILLCSGKKGYACSKNIFNQKNICYLCNKNKLKGINLLKGNFRIVYTPTLSINSDNLRKSIFKTPNNLKKFKYKKTDIGQSVYSSYLGLSRDYEFEGILSEKSCRNLLSTSITIHDFFEDYLKKNKIEKILLFNGRHNQYRPIVRIAQKKKIKVEVSEFFENGLNERSVRQFDNHLPGDIKNFAKDIERVWKKNPGSKKSKNYFKDKAEGRLRDDTTEFVSKQKPSLLPLNWDQKKRNIVYFTSSQDEYAALGGEYDQLVYKDQFDSIKKIADSIKKEKNKDIIFWIKCHPNSKNIFWNYHQKIYHLNDPENNIFVIKSNSKISTYEVMRNCEKVITFNSLVGIESVYWKKPSIVIGRRVYEKLECIYKPKSHKKVMELVLDKNLKPKSILGAYKFSNHWAEGGTKLKYLSGSIRDKISFKFKNINFNYGFFDLILYSFEKFKQIYFYNYLISFKLKSLFKIKK